MLLSRLKNRIDFDYAQATFDAIVKELRSVLSPLNSMGDPVVTLNSVGKLVIV
jgi:hypothetical protein